MASWCCCLWIYSLKNAQTFDLITTDEIKPTNGLFQLNPHLFEADIESYTDLHMEATLDF